jgi:EAL domain-containing protein (putative c-di-GMP-specific phosphodiesterase class I)
MAGQTRGRRLTAGPEPFGGIQCCNQRRFRERWQGKSVRNLAISINVSGRQLMTAGFADLVATALLAGSVDPSLLTLDITEDVFVSDSARAAVVHQALKNIGVRLALDDFGTGYSSITHLIDYPVDTIKMDGALIGMIVPDVPGNTIVSSMIDLAHGLGKAVVSEGVETIEQYNELVRLGCDYCQGFYFAWPMSAAALAALIHDDTGDSPRLPIPQRISLDLMPSSE